MLLNRLIRRVKKITQNTKKGIETDQQKDGKIAKHLHQKKK